MPKTKRIVKNEPTFTAGNESAGLLNIKPNAIEKRILMKKHNEKIALFLDDNPIEIEYIEAVMANVASVGLQPVFHISKISGNSGTSICSITHVRNSVVSSLTPGIARGLLALLLVIFIIAVIFIRREQILLKTYLSEKHLIS
ncbi:hypothetical protein ACROAK_06895 [Shewanella oncorhynchi]|uniref:hypothetical protein n=1 Tax=Shewanella oncorhynchi TaxID=2726434 RepID=UPI003D7A8DB3